MNTRSRSKSRRKNVGNNLLNSFEKIFKDETGVQIFTNNFITNEISVTPFDQRVPHSNKKVQRSNLKRKEIHIQPPNSKDPINNGFTSFSMKKDNISRFDNVHVRTFPIENTNQKDEIKTPNYWTKNEEIYLICVCLIKRVLKKIKISKFVSIFRNKNNSQVHGHLHKNRKNIVNFCDVFFKYYNSPNKLGIDADQPVEYIFPRLTKQILDEDFISYFQDNIKNEKCAKYFQNIYSHILLEPKFYIQNICSKKDFSNSHIYPQSPAVKVSSQRVISQCDLGYDLKNIKLKLDLGFLRKLKKICSDPKKLILDDYTLIKIISNDAEMDDESDNCLITN